MQKNDKFNFSINERLTRIKTISEQIKETRRKIIFRDKKHHRKKNRKRFKECKRLREATETSLEDFDIFNFVGISVETTKQTFYE